MVSWGLEEDIGEEVPGRGWGVKRVEGWRVEGMREWRGR